ncbi:DinB family protein [Paraglaciecola hydrolytica]|uniref:Diguanylate cyclase n=1 Tax=Paraglaciecola hydrolytica TaxID=1799789 RepID=A0A136A1P2_9ALTE|nr:DinB family protein [Paraglaciecola hydrolytica]KXI29134.1 diguanylate cyclase [Paraglaciecola hydrolytica]
MFLQSNFELLAHYNHAMNVNIYAAAAKLSQADVAKNQGAYFGSIINTLNHILVADTIWLQRFATHLSQLTCLEYVRGLAVPTSLDLVLYSDLTELTEYREKMDDVITQFAAKLTEPALLQAFTYKNMKGITFTKNLSHVIQHFFNHQTHHRGQVSTLLYQQGIDLGVTDLLLHIPNIE